MVTHNQDKSEYVLHLYNICHTDMDVFVINGKIVRSFQFWDISVVHILYKYI